MMRKSPTSAMQKTYDECYLICSTAIYFEGQNNESEALRAWRNALDHIYYHNAYKMPSGYSPRTETERALQDSLRAMELQCKERVDLLEALRKSRLEAEEDAKGNGDGPSKSRESLAAVNANANRPSPHTNKSASASWLGGDTIPQASYADIPRPAPTPERRPVQPKRPSYLSTRGSDNDAPRALSMQPSSSPSLAPPADQQTRARTPSPEKKSGGMLKTLRSNPKERTSSSKMATTMRSKAPPAAAKAATQSWSGQQRPSGSAPGPANGSGVTVTSPNATTWDPYTRSLVDRSSARDTASQDRRASGNPVIRPPSPSDYMKPKQSNSSPGELRKSNSYPAPYPDYPGMDPYSLQSSSHSNDTVETAKSSPPPPPPPPHRQSTPTRPSFEKARPAPPSLSQMGPSSLSYMKEYPNHPPAKPRKPPTVPAKPTDRVSDSDGASRLAPPKTVQAQSKPAIPRKAVGRAVGVVSATAERQKLDDARLQLDGRVKAESQASRRDYMSSSPELGTRRPSKRRTEAKAIASRAMTPPSTDDSPDSDHPTTPTEEQEWESRVKQVMKNLPKGVDEAAAKQIFNEIVIHGDEVHWDDVAGLEIAKSALKETVVYPFLRPDLFMGLREPARGMLLFGPPGTGKTMLARAVATESKSIFFAISASSLTSKYLGESEKLVRALFALAKALAPSIIFVDEIDSLLGARGGSSEHEATRRIKTEFLIQWSDLQKAAAGREDKEKGDATRVLVLAATNLPWAIDEAARRRFVRRQYIPLPEDWVREKQLRNLIAAQKHNLKDRDLQQLVRLTDSFSGSDITALAKDAAMGPLRSLGERLLHMSPEDIRPILMEDFQASLVNIRPSVSKEGLKQFEDWAKEFGERGG
ncbi:hypothetical protein LTR36_008838 [Oleoguttula mirabilis]|uniref:AAA+ ATPase domain-containing protein n=1 Tax=Oleoguttula mirabilis TaxID=1507867 RepID=A0AAV9J826_9PEZI|nr:hypothetical protein LTR36_008838 [Oleoguttula mirabilis]